MSALAMLLGGAGRPVRPAEPAKQHFPGCVPLHGDRPSYNADANASKLTSIPVTEVTAVKAEPVRGRGKRVAANDRLRCYTMKNFIRVVDNLGEHRVLLRGHEASVVDIVVRLPIRTSFAIFSCGYLGIAACWCALCCSVLEYCVGHPDVLSDGRCHHDLAPVFVAIGSQVRSPRQGDITLVVHSR